MKNAVLLIKTILFEHLQNVDEEEVEEEFITFLIIYLTFYSEMITKLQNNNYSHLIHREESPEWTSPRLDEHGQNGQWQTTG